MERRTLRRVIAVGTAAGVGAVGLAIAPWRDGSPSSAPTSTTTEFTSTTTSTTQPERRISEYQLQNILRETSELRGQIFLPDYSVPLERAVRDRKDDWSVEKKSITRNLPYEGEEEKSSVEQLADILFGDNAEYVLARLQEPSVDTPDGTLIRALGIMVDPDGGAADIAPIDVIAKASRGKARVLSTIFTDGYNFVESGPGSERVKTALGKLMVERGFPVVAGEYCSIYCQVEDKFRPLFEEGAPDYTKFLNSIPSGFSPSSSDRLDEKLNAIKWDDAKYKWAGEWILGDIRDKIQKRAEVDQKFSSAKGVLGPVIEMGPDLEKAYSIVMDEALREIFAEIFRATLQSDVPLSKDIERGVEEVLSAWAEKEVKLSDVRAALK